LRLFHASVHRKPPTGATTADCESRCLHRTVTHRRQMRGLFVNLPPCAIGMEACASAHYWARTLESYGHTVRLIAPHFVKPYVKTHKTDATESEAICEAVSRPNMRFVPIKRSRASSNSRHYHCTACARVLYGRALRGRTEAVNVGLWPVGVHLFWQTGCVSAWSQGGRPATWRRLSRDVIGDAKRASIRRASPMLARPTKVSWVDTITSRENCVSRSRPTCRKPCIVSAKRFARNNDQAKCFAPCCQLALPARCVALLPP
jgi:hypothetical protein